MTCSDYRKVFKQLNAKPVKLRKFLKYNKPKDRKFGRSTKKCRRCGSTRAHISSYGLNLCRRCLRETALYIGFKKYS